LAKAALVWWLVPRLYPAPRPAAAPSAGLPSGVLSTDALRVAAILGAAILLWATDFLHGIRPGYIAIAAGALCYLPKVGVLPMAQAFDRSRLLLTVWIAGVLALSSLMSETGASTLLSSALSYLAAVEGKSPAYGYFAIAYLTSLMTLLATMGGTVPTMMAAVGGISQATGLPIETGLVSLAAGSTALFLPYVAAPMVVGLTLGKVTMTEASRFTLWSAAISWVTIIPLNALWWYLIGALP